MAISKLLYRMIVLLAVAGLWIGNDASAQVLPVLNSFNNRTFDGTVDVSWPVLFDGCTFRTDSMVLKHSYGAVFRNCRLESRSGVLYVAGSGDGIVLADCEVTGCDGLIISKEYDPAYRNYVTGVTVNGEECSVLEEQASIIDIDGLEFAECVSGSRTGPLFMLMSADRKVIGPGETVNLKVIGLEENMFIGWQISDDDLKLSVDEGGLSCRVTAPETVRTDRRVLISAYTEYGLEAAVTVEVRR